MTAPPPRGTTGMRALIGCEDVVKSMPELYTERSHTFDV